MLRKEALVMLVNLSGLTAEKMDEPISHVCGWINAIVILVTRLYSQMIQGDSLPSLPAELGSGMGPGIRPQLSKINRAQG